MDIKKVERNGVAVAVVGTDLVLSDAASALDLIANARCSTGADRMILPKSAVVEEFFILSNGLAGDVLQKFVNYRMKLAIYGDFSRYTSVPLRDFMRESNRGRDIYFAPTYEEALLRLCGADNKGRT